MTQQLSKANVAHAERLFLSPEPQYEWDQIIAGVQVCFSDGRTERRDAVGTTFRGFYKLNKALRGAKEVYDSFFVQNERTIQANLSAVTDRNALHRLCDEWRQQIVRGLSNIRSEHVTSYGKTRKPIDLYVMNLVAMATELNEARRRLVPLLFLPLDSQMFQKAFTDDELRPFGLSHRSTYGDVKGPDVYLALQQLACARVRDLSEQLGYTVHPIYLEMLWRDRLDNRGSNLFTASPMRSK